ncbi:hypothetical protein ACSZNG_03670 [Aeromonas hydrophila]
MARPTNANLELAKARKSNGALELNPAHVVRLLGVLQAVASGPKLAAEVAIIHPATLASTPVPRMQAAALLGQQGQLVATSPAPTANIQARVVIEASMASTLHPVIPRFEAEYDINVFRGPSHQVADDWQLAGELTDAVAESWEVAANQRVTLTGDWQEAVADHSQVGWSIDQAPRCYQLGGSDWQEGQALGAHHGQPMESLPPGHVQVAGLWSRGRRPASGTSLATPTHPGATWLGMSAGRRRSGSACCWSATGNSAISCTSAGWTAGMRPSGHRPAPAHHPSPRSSRRSLKSADCGWRLAGPGGTPPLSSSGSARMRPMSFQPGGSIW